MSLVSTSPYEGVISPVYRRGTWTHALHRAHLADTRPVAGSTFRMALWMTTSFWRATTTFALQTGHRRDVVGSVLVVISAARENTHSRSRLSRAFGRGPTGPPGGLGGETVGRANVPGPPGGRMAGGVIHGKKRLRRDIRAVDAGPRRLLGRGRGGHPLGPALGPSLRRLAPALLSLVQRRRAQHLLQRARPAHRSRARQAAGA